MRFAAATWLWALLLLPLLGLLWREGERRAGRRLRAELGPRAPAQVEGVRPGRRFARRLLLVGGCACLILALARPQWGAHALTIKERGADVVVALDVSNSMLAEDVPPSRLELAKATLGAFLDDYDRGRVGLVLFAGAAYVQCPLTLDRATARLFLTQAAPDMISQQGTSFAAALATARELLARGRGTARDGAPGAILLVTDGEDQTGEWQAEADACREAGIVLVPVGVGSEGGGLIPRPDGDGYVKDASGAVVLSRYDPNTLAALAERGGGTFLSMGTGGLDLRRLRGLLQRLRERELEERRIAAYEERFVWPLALALLLLAAREAWRPWRRPAAGSGRLRLGRRRRALPATAAAAGAGSGPGPAAAARAARPGGAPPPRGAAAAALALVLAAAFAAGASASVVAPLRPAGAEAADRGRELFAAGRYEEALQAFESARALNPEDARLTLAVGAALARLGRRDEALREFARARGQAGSDELRAEGLYNEGTVRLAGDDAAGAVKALRQALALTPSAADVRRNLELALKRLRAEQRGGGQRQRDGADQNSQERQQGQAGQQGQQGEQSQDRQGQQGQPDQHGRQDQPDQPRQASPSPDGQRPPASDRQDRAQSGDAGQEQAPEQPAAPESRAGDAAERRAGEPTAMSREQAVELLRALDRDELELRRSVQKRLRGKPAPGGKPW